MRLPGSASLIGAFLCPRGVFMVECRRGSGGIAIQRTLAAPLPLESTIGAADHLINVLRSEGIKRAEVAIALRGFGVTHHVLQMPPAKDEMLSPIVDREMHRREPQLGPAIVGWIPLPALLGGGAEAAGQRSLLAAAIPTDVAAELQERVEAGGYRLLHLTALPAAMQRLLEEFDAAAETAALVAPLPDGAFLGFALDGGLRLVVEPPLPAGAEHESAALAEELELGAMFVRQQFRGMDVERITVVGSSPAFSDLESTLTDRLHVPAKRLDVADMEPASYAALGAVLDAQSARPLSLGGVTRERALAGAASFLEKLSTAAVIVLALLGMWVMVEIVRAKQTLTALEVARRRVAQDSFGLAPIRATAAQRKNVRDAVGAMRLVADDRVELQHMLGEIAAIIRPPIVVDTLLLRRVATGWSASLAGSVRATSNARAVQTLHDAYRELPARTHADSLHLDQLTYADSTEAGMGEVRFQLSFGVRAPARKD